MSKSVNKNKKRTAFTRRNIAIGVVVLLVAIPLTMYAYGIWLSKIESSKFSSLRNSVDQMAADIAGGTNSTVKHECTLPGVKFQKADYQCSSSISTSTDVTSEDWVKTKVDEYVAAIKNNDDFSLSDSNRSHYPDLSRGIGIDTHDLALNYNAIDASGLVEFNHKASGIKCSLFSAIKSRKLSIMIDCSSSAKANYF